MREVEYSAKYAYEDSQVACDYDRARFSGPIGRFKDRIEKDAVERLLQAVGNRGQVLDVPCGTGRFSGLALAENFRVVACDISPAMLRVTEGKLGQCDNLSLIQADIEHLPFKSNVFDGVTCMRLMGHVPPAIRLRIERELGLVSKQHVILSYQNPFSLTGACKAAICRIRRREWYLISRVRLRKEFASFDLEVAEIARVGLEPRAATSPRGWLQHIQRFIGEFGRVLINLCLTVVAETDIALVQKKRFL